MVRNRILIIVFAGLALTGSAYADMMPVSSPDTGSRPSAPVVAATDGQTRTPDLAACSGLIDLGGPSFGFLPDAKENAEPAVDTQQCPILTDDLDSFSLCLYALMGLGVCRSAPWVKRLHLGHIPDWYHSGAPQQIGHSHAVGPDAFCHAAVCFVQPDVTAERLMPLYRTGTLASLVRHSQFTSTILASRAPPHLTHESSMA